MNNTKEFSIWLLRNAKDLRKQYKDYLKHTVLEDDGFEVEATEDFYTWCNVEFERLEEEKEATSD